MTARFSHDALPLHEGREILSATDLLPTGHLQLEDPQMATGSASAAASAATYVPEYYEPNYAYPLLIWLHDEGGSERDLWRIMPQVSLRNYFGYSLRGPLDAKNSRNGYRWSLLHDDVVELEEALYAGVGRLRRAYHIHSERVFIGGCGIGATLALQLGLRRPEWFAGAVSVSGHFPEMEKPLAKYRMLQGKRTLLTTRSKIGRTDLELSRKLGTLLHTAGMRVTSRVYDGSDQLSGDVLRDIDRWMMQECYGGVAVDC